LTINNNYFVELILSEQRMKTTKDNINKEIHLGRLL